MRGKEGCLREWEGKGAQLSLISPFQLIIKVRGVRDGEKEQKTNKTFYFNDSSDTFKLRTIKRVRFRSRAIRNANQKSSS